MKRLISVVLAFSALMFCHITFAAGQQNTPESQVRAFYTWYIKLNASLKNPLVDKKISGFVSKEVVDRLRDDYRHNRLPGDSDYFLRVQDEDEKDWLAHIATHPPVMLGDVAVVPITFGSTDKVSVLVFMRRVDGIWKITKTEDTLDYQGCSCGLQSSGLVKSCSVTRQAHSA